MKNSSPPQEDIYFGLNRESDERSLALFLDRFADERLLTALIPRMSDGEIIQLVDTLSGLMRKHFSEREYHRLFLGEERSPHSGKK